MDANLTKAEPDDGYTTASHWGMFRLPKHEPEVLAARKRFEKILHPVCEQLVDFKV